jgi:hypothetical protein
MATQRHMRRNTVPQIQSPKPALRCSHLHGAAVIDDP